LAKHKAFVVVGQIDLRNIVNQILGIAIAFILVVGIIQFTISIATASNSLNIFPPGVKPYGISYSEHMQNFWKWLLAIPSNASPLNDETGEKCSADQINTNSTVFYLATAIGKSERTCTVPVGKGLFIPVMMVEFSDKEMPGASVEELGQATKKDQDTVNSLYLKIDNMEYKYDNLTKYRIHTEPFIATFPKEGIFGVTESGNSTVVAEGFYVITEPLAKGNHTINYKSSVSPDPTSTEPPYAQDVTYRIIAK
jgi:hypothetical protein